jgi:D-alanyl-D-alanine carboxypeptidase
MKEIGMGVVMVYAMLSSVSYRVPYAQHNIFYPLSFAQYREDIVVLQQKQGLPNSLATITKIPVKKENAPRVPTISAKAALLVDDESDAILWEQDASQQIPLASLTKLISVMTYLDLGIDPNRKYTITKGDVIDERSNLAEGDVVASRDLVMMALVGSSNSAAHALMTSSGLTKEYFVARMNMTAKKLGLNNTIFVEPTGLAPENRGTAYDVYRLLKAARVMPQFVDSAKLPSFEYAVSETKTKTIAATDALITGKVPFHGEKIIAAKTGYIPESGFHLAITAKDASGRIRTAVVLGADDTLLRFSEADALLLWSSRAFTVPR